MSALASVKHLLVDLDGTLLGARNTPLQIEFVLRSVRALKKHGGWWKALKALGAVNRELAHAPREVIQELTNDKRAAGAFAHAIGVPLAEGERILEETVGALFPSLQRYFYPMENAVEFLKWAKERYTMTLATNPVWTEDIVKLRLQWAGVPPEWFDHITHARIMHATKPSAAYYEEILSRLKLEPRQCLLIGNDLKMDLPATRVGIPVFIVTQDPDARPIPSLRTPAPAWRGPFRALRSMLEEKRAIS